MTVEPAAFLLLALVLGVKHAFDADHLVAVGNVLIRAPDRRRTVTYSAAWAVGHMLTAGLLTVGLFLARDALPAALLARMGLLVAGMLVAIGLAALVAELRVVHAHRHAHGGAEHAHAHAHWLGRLARHRHGTMMGIGVVHGVASNDELLTLLAAGLGVTSLGGLLAGVGVFSLGVVAGMVLFGLALTMPLLRARGERLRRGASVAAALLSVGYGAWMLAGLA
jgi:high-affinity nickel-transport protein